MKHYFSSLLVIIALGVHAQNCHFHNVFTPPGTYLNWKGGARLSDGGVAAILDGDDGTIHLMRWGADAQLVWNKRMQHQDPDTWFNQRNVRVGPNDAIFACGDLFPVRYEEMYGVKFNGDGTQAWARYFMADSAMADHGGRMVDLAPLPSGGCLLTSLSPYGITATRLDDAGVPLWSKRYQPSLLPILEHAIPPVIYPNGEVLLIAANYTQLFLVHINASGVPDWSHAYSTTMNVRAATRTANGDLLFTGFDSNNMLVAIRTDAQGTMLWRNGYNTIHSGNGVTELPSGHLLLGGEGSPAQLVETDASGSPLNAWVSSYQDFSHIEPFLVPYEPTTSDSVLIGFLTLNADGYGNAVLTATSPSNMDCFMLPASVVATPITDTFTDTDSLVVFDDVVKSWTMNLGPSLPSNVLDLECAIGATSAVPGFTSIVFATVSNISERTSGPVTATMTLDPVMNYANAQPAPTSIVGNTVTWSLPALTAFEQVNLSVQATVPADPGLLGHQVIHTITALEDSAEWTLANNSRTARYHVVGSFDPNDKLVWPEGHYDIMSDTLLTYTIRFQNTGTAAAQNVVVVDTLPLDLDVSTFRMGAASHPYTFSITGNGILRVSFENIQLPDSTSDEVGSHGLFTFTIAPILPVTLGQTITNAADIYFDLNPPIRTPDATVVVTDASGISTMAAPERLTVFPVPSTQAITARMPSHQVPVIAWVIGVDGKRQRRTPQATNESGTVRFDIQDLVPGPYVLVLFDRAGHRSAARFIRE